MSDTFPGVLYWQCGRSRFTERAYSTAFWVLNTILVIKETLGIFTRKETCALSLRDRDKRVAA